MSRNQIGEGIYRQKLCEKKWKWKKSQNRMGKCITNIRWKMADIAMRKASSNDRTAEKNYCKRNPKTRNLVCERWSHLYLCWAGRFFFFLYVFFVKCSVSFLDVLFFFLLLKRQFSFSIFIYVPLSCTECTNMFDVCFFRILEFRCIGKCQLLTRGAVLFLLFNFT